MPLFNSFEYVCRIAIAGSDGNPMTHFLGNQQIVFHSSCTILYSPPTMYEGFNLSTCFLFFPSNYSYPCGCEVTAETDFLNYYFFIFIKYNVNFFPPA